MHISNNQKTMTVKEIAKAFNCKERTIQYRAKEMFPELVRNGVETRLNEAQVTAIKLKLDKNYSLEFGFELPKTALEEDLIIRQAMFIQRNRINSLQEKNKLLEHENHQLKHCGKTYTTSEIAKEMQMRSAQQLNSKLHDMGIVYKRNNTWLLTGKYAESGYMEIKQEIRPNGYICYNARWTGVGRNFIITEIGTQND